MLEGLRGHERAQLRVFGPFAHAASHRAIGASWYGAVGEAAATVEIHYSTGGSLLTSRRAVQSESAKEHFLRHVAQHEANERLRTLENRSQKSMDRAIELARSERERVDDKALTSRDMTVGDASWPSWEIEIDDLVYRWVSLPDYDVYATGDRAFVSSRIDIVVPA